MHNFNKINLYIIDVVPNLESRLKIESLYMCKLNTIYPYGLNSVLMAIILIILIMFVCIVNLI